MTLRTTGYAELPRESCRLEWNPGFLCVLSSRDFAVVECAVGSSFVGDHEPPEVVRESSLSAAHRLVAGLALGDLVVEVAASGAVTHADLGDRDQMDRRVELPVPATRQAVPCPVT